MDTLITLLISIGLTAGIFLIWCLYKLYDSVHDSTKKIIQFVLYGLLIVCATVMAFLFPNSIFMKAFLTGISAVIIMIICFLPHWIKKLARNLNKKRKKAQLTPFKIEIVNNESYINLKKADRIAFLRDLKRKTSVELTKQRKKLEKEKDKLKDIPADVAKYIKIEDTSSFEKNIKILEKKIKAIDELIDLETVK